MTISSRQKMPLPPRIRIRLRAARVLIVAILLLMWSRVFGLAAVPLLFVLVAAWALRTNEVENGRN